MNLLTPEIVARELFTTVGTLSKWRLRGCGPRYVKIGPRSIAYPKEEVEAWLRENIMTSTSGGGRGGRKAKSAVQD